MSTISNNDYINSSIFDAIPTRSPSYIVNNCTYAVATTKPFHEDQIESVNKTVDEILKVYEKYKDKDVMIKLPGQMYDDINYSPKDYFSIPYSSRYGPQIEHPWRHGFASRPLIEYIRGINYDILLPSGLGPSSPGVRLETFPVEKATLNIRTYNAGINDLSTLFLEKAYQNRLEDKVLLASMFVSILLNIGGRSESFTTEIDIFTNAKRSHKSLPENFVQKLGMLLSSRDSSNAVNVSVISEKFLKDINRCIDDAYEDIKNGILLEINKRMINNKNSRPKSYKEISSPRDPDAKIPSTQKSVKSNSQADPQLYLF